MLALLSHALREIALLAHWEIIAAGPPARVSVNVQPLPVRPITRRVLGPRATVAATLGLPA